MKDEKMIKTAKALDKVFKILQRIFLICAVAGVVVIGMFTVIRAVAPDSVVGMAFDLAFYSVDIGSLTFDLAKEAVPDSGAILFCAWIMLAAAVAFIAIAYYMLGIFRRILKPMTEGNPFAPCVSREIRKLAFASLAVGVISNGMDFVQTWGVVHIIDLNRLLQSSQIESVGVNYRYDQTFVLTFFVLLLVSYVFRYGETLQKLSDETL